MTQSMTLSPPLLKKEGKKDFFFEIHWYDWKFCLIGCGNFAGIFEDAGISR